MNEQGDGWIGHEWLDGGWKTDKRLTDGRINGYLFGLLVKNR